MSVISISSWNKSGSYLGPTSLPSSVRKMILEFLSSFSRWGHGRGETEATKEEEGKTRNGNILQHPYNAWNPNSLCTKHEIYFADGSIKEELRSLDL